MLPKKPRRTLHKATKRRSSHTDVIKAATLPLSAAWWLICHPMQLIIVAFAAFWVIPTGWLP